MQSSDNKFPKWTLLLIPVVLCAVFFKSFFTLVPTGHVGVQILFGSVQSAPMGEGFNFKNPMMSVTEISVQVQKHTATYNAASKDMQRVHVDMVLNYRLIPEKAPEVYKTIGSDYEKIIIDPAAQEVLKAVTAKHEAAEILHERATLKTEVEKNLAVWLNKYGIELKEAALADLKFDPAYEQAIEQKQIQEQKAEQKKYELLQAQRQAEIVAANAKGEADATRIRGEAEAAYNRNVSQSLTGPLVQQLYLKKWDGKLPQFLMDSKGGNLLFQVDPPKPEAKHEPENK